jgi:GH3 auxin-responsive promoter
MRITRELRARLGIIPRALVRREAARFLQAAKNCRSAQSQVLVDLLALNAGSRFSREHRLDGVRNATQYRRRVPVVDYEYFRPYIEDVKAGQHDALLGPKNRLLMFSLTSGTTAQAKYIPITDRFLADYRSGWQAWGIQAIDAHPGINNRMILQLSSDFDLFRTPGGTPCGNISGLVAACQKRIVRTMYTVPGAVAKIRNSDAKLYTTMRLAVAERSIGMVMTANPSTLIQMARLSDLRKEDLIRDIADGTLAEAEHMPAELHSAIGHRLSRKDKARAAELEAIVDRTGRLVPRDFWPEMKLLALWTGGSAGAYLPALKDEFGQVPIRDHGLSASEGRMTIPVADGTPSGILDVTTHFFEFIPESEYGSPDATVLEAHELEEGKNYYILLTTSSGLCRYNICDVVRCTGFYHSTPMVEFLHKGAHIANLTGEKISESQVVTAVRAASDEMRVCLSNFTLSPVWGNPPKYHLHAEHADLAAPHLGDSLANLVDERLKSLNCEYRDKRASGRLAPIQWVPLPHGTWSTFGQLRRQKSGGSVEQYKHPCLVPDLEFSSKLLVEIAAPLAAESTSHNPAILPMAQAVLPIAEQAHRAAG